MFALGWRYDHAAPDAANALGFAEIPKENMANKKQTIEDSVWALTMAYSFRQ